MKDERQVAFEASLQSAFRVIRQGKGQCPDTETLAGFLDGRLGEAEANKVKLHLGSCGVCDLVLEKMKAFEAEVTASDDKPLGLRAYAVENRLRAALKQRAGQANMSRVAGGWWTVAGMYHLIGVLVWYLKSPVVAYVLVLVLAYPAYRGLRFHVQAPAPPSAAVERPTAAQPTQPGMIPAKLLELRQTRSALDHGSAVNLTHTDREFVLAFFVPARKGFSYRAEVLDIKLSVIVAQTALSGNEQGDFQLICDRKRFVPGTYALKVFESPAGLPASEKLVAEYEFAVRSE
jgi:hypothetical protein